MSLALGRLLTPVGHICRLGASSLIAGVWRRRTPSEVEDRLRALPMRDQVLAVGGVLALLFLVAVFAAQFGIIGMLAFWLGVVLLVN